MNLMTKSARNLERRFLNMIVLEVAEMVLFVNSAAELGLISNQFLN